MADRCLLYYITDRTQFLGDESSRRHALLRKIAEATVAGVDYIQLREKDLSARELEMLALDALRAVRESTPLKTESREFRTRVLVNSRTDVALAAGADGVHLRSDDLTPDEARGVVKASALRPITADQFLVAVSCHTVADVFNAEAERADFAVFAPVFGKNGDSGALPTGVDALREACRAKIPVFALGGVTLGNASLCLRAGAAGIAGIRLFQENKIEDVVRALRGAQVYD
jgi:thiamine-phosphate pyrophosphorylase